MNSNMNETIEMIKDPQYFIFKSSGFYFIFCALITIPVMIVLNLLRYMIPYNVLYVLSGFIPYCCMLLVLIAFLQGYKMWFVMGFKLPNIFAVFMMIPVVVFSYPMMLFISVFCESIYPQSTLQFTNETLNTLIELGPVSGWLILAVIPGVVEELICRGFIFGIFRRRSFVTATFVSTICFALLHLNLQQALYAFVFGLLLSLIREITKSVWPGVFAHVIFNSAAVINIYYGDKIYPSASDNAVFSTEPVVINTLSEFFAEYGSLMILAVGFGIVLWFVIFILKKIMKYEPDKRVDYNVPVLIGTYIIGWVLCVGLSVLLS